MLRIGQFAYLISAIIACNMLTSRCTAAPDAESLASEMRPAWAARMAFFGESPEHANTFAVNSLRAANKLPSDPSKAEAVVAESRRFLSLFFGFLTDAKSPIDAAWLRQFASNPAQPQADRSRAYILLYVVKGSTDDAAQAICISPQFIGLFCKLKDPNFAQLARAMLAEADREKLSPAAPGAPPPETPFTMALRDAADRWFEALYFQGVPGGLMEQFWNDADYFGVLITRGADLDVLVLYRNLAGISSLGAEALVDHLLEGGRETEVLRIMNSLPEHRGEIRAIVSSYRLALKKKLDITTPLMSAPTTK